MPRADGEGRPDVTGASLPPDVPSIQERILPEGMCYGCGPANPQGLHLRSFAYDDEVVASVVIPASMQNGYGIANGGIVTMVLDCHTGAVVADALGDFDWATHPPFLTSSLNVSLLRPTPLDVPLAVTGRLAERRSTELVAEAEIVGPDGRVTASIVAGWRPVLRRL